MSPGFISFTIVYGNGKWPNLAPDFVKALNITWWSKQNSFYGSKFQFSLVLYSAVSFDTKLFLSFPILQILNHTLILITFSSRVLGNFQKTWNCLKIFKKNLKVLENLKKTWRGLKIWKKTWSCLKNWKNLKVLENLKKKLESTWKFEKKTWKCLKIWKKTSSTWQFKTFLLTTWLFIKCHFIYNYLIYKTLKATILFADIFTIAIYSLVICCNVTLSYTIYLL